MVRDRSQKKHLETRLYLAAGLVAKLPAEHREPAAPYHSPYFRPGDTGRVLLHQLHIAVTAVHADIAELGENPYILQLAVEPQRIADALLQFERDICRGVSIICRRFYLSVSAGLFVRCETKFAKTSGDRIEHSETTLLLAAEQCRLHAEPHAELREFRFGGTEFLSEE